MNGREKCLRYLEEALEGPWGIGPATAREVAARIRDLIREELEHERQELEHELEDLGAGHEPRADAILSFRRVLVRHFPEVAEDHAQRLAHDLYETARAEIRGTP